MKATRPHRQMPSCLRHPTSLLGTAVAAGILAMLACVPPAADNSGQNSLPTENTGTNGQMGTDAGSDNTGSNQNSTPTDTGGTNSSGSESIRISVGSFVVYGYNDLGMHCINQDFSELMLLPPYNNLHAQVIQRGHEPRIVDTGLTVRYRIPNNTTSVNKTNFWSYANALLGVNLAPDVGLTGKGLAGTMTPTGTNDWEASGIPITPINDFGHEDSYPLASITVEQNGNVVASTAAVVPVSWEISCNLCHHSPGVSTETDILNAHDRRHGTDLAQHKPVLCAGCHADPALNAAGQPGVSTLSSAMHTAHAPRVAAANLAVDCYACHPGVRTQCLRDVHYAKGMQCNDCHTSMLAVGNPSRRPWVDEPRCESCHHRTGFTFEQPNTRYRDSKGHGGVHCEACHGSPHAITPTVTAEDNQQAIGLQGHSGVINKCALCHINQPDDAFFHSVSDDSGGD